MFFSTGGGFPFGGFDEPRRSKPTNNTKFYEVLGVSKDASVAEVKKAYRKLAIQHHPDKGGDQDVFKNISRAYEILSDPEKRETYDKYGEEGLEGSGGAEAQDIFDLFFGGGRSRKGPAQKRKGQDIASSLKVTLQQLYKGATRKLAVNRDIICTACDGLGGAKEDIEKCRTCDGQGVRIQIRQVGPMIQQTQAKCHVCDGEGSTMAASKRCAKCRGEKTVKERKVLEIYIEPGAPPNHKVVFSGEADERPGEIPGDVVFVFDQQDHHIFKRKNSDLFMEKEITLYEALTGYKFCQEHLDGRYMIIQSHPGEMTKPGDIRCVSGEGMPQHKNPFVKGNLYIVITVAFPEPGFLTPEAKEILRRMLPQPQPLPIDENDADIEHHFVSNTQPGEPSPSHRGNSEAYEEDEGMGGGGQRVQCRQQ